MFDFLNCDEIIPILEKDKIKYNLIPPRFVVILDSPFPQIQKTSASGARTTCHFCQV